MFGSPFPFKGEAFWVACVCLEASLMITSERCMYKSDVSQRKSV